MPQALQRVVLNFCDGTRMRPIADGFGTPGNIFCIVPILRGQDSGAHIGADTMGAHIGAPLRAQELSFDYAQDVPDKQ